MKHFALIYDVVPDFTERRAPFREAHLQRVRDANARGILLLAGALGDPPDGGLLVFRADSPAVVEDFARADPYVTQGVVTAWRVRPWTVVVGADPVTPKAL
jgi:uncharacterized protein YciI